MREAKSNKRKRHQPTDMEVDLSRIKDLEDEILILENVNSDDFGDCIMFGWPETRYRKIERYKALIDELRAKVANPNSYTKQPKPAISIEPPPEIESVRRKYPPGYFEEQQAAMMRGIESHGLSDRAEIRYNGGAVVIDGTYWYYCLSRLVRRDDEDDSWWQVKDFDHFVEKFVNGSWGLPRPSAST